MNKTLSISDEAKSGDRPISLAKSRRPTRAERDKERATAFHAAVEALRPLSTKDRAMVVASLGILCFPHPERARDRSVRAVVSRGYTYPPNE